MSGGSMDYLYHRVNEAHFKLDSVERRAFKKHLMNVADALKAIEWNDSGDGDSKENEKILSCLSKDACIKTAIEDARSAMAELVRVVKDTELRERL